MAKILIVDDDQSYCSILGSILEDCGYSVTQAENGNAALKITSTQAFDLVVTDLEMPIMNGKELVKAIRDSGNKIQVLLTSGSFDNTFEARDAAESCGANMGLSKKDFDIFSHVIGEMLQSNV